MKNTLKIRLDEAQMSDLREAVNISVRHYSHLAQEAHVLGDPDTAAFLEAKSRHFLALASQAQDVERVTVRLREEPITPFPAF